MITPKKAWDFFPIGFFFLFYIIMNAEAARSVNVYEDIFTAEIYDISDATRQRFRNVPLSDWEVGKDWLHLIQNKVGDVPEEQKILFYQKLLYVHERITKFLKQTKDFTQSARTQLRNVHDAAEEAEARKTISTGISGFFKGIGDFLMKGPGFFADIMYSEQNLASTLADKKISKEACLGACDKTITEVELEIRKLEDGVFTEPIVELEKTYMRKKGEGRIAPDLQYMIENNLINSRKASYPFPFIRQCVEYALCLPGRCKELDTSEDWLENFRKDKFFHNYTPATREKLEIVLLNIIFSSKTSEVGAVPLRKAYYFHGEAGIGKSSAAQKLAEFLGLPVFKISLRSAQDLTADSLEGSEALSPRVNVGWLARPLLTPDNEGQTYLNSVLILDDFDRILLDPNSGVPSLALLLDYLDPLKKKFYSPYFAANLDISRMHIIITGNSPLPDTAEYQPLRERFSDIISFDPMSPDVQKIILTEYLRSLEQFYGLGNGQLGEHEAMLLDQCIRTAEHPASLRSLQKTLSNIVGIYKIGGIESVRKINKNSSQGTNKKSYALGNFVFWGTRALLYYYLFR